METTMRKLLTFLIALAAIVFGVCFPASAQMTLTGAGSTKIAAAGGGGGGFSLTYQSSIGSTDITNTTVDYGTLSYGSGNTRVVVAIQWLQNFTTPATITGVTVGGVSLAQVSGVYLSNGIGNSALDMWESTSSLSGTSGDVQVTYTTHACCSSVVALYNLQTTTPAASTSTSAWSGGGSHFSVSVGPYTVPSSGGSIVESVLDGSNQTIGFTNATVDQTLTVASNGYAFGHTTSTGAVTVSATWASGWSGAIAVAAWGP
jgi:hypothetical protein